MLERNDYLNALIMSSTKRYLISALITRSKAVLIASG
ncbi:unnamed protein product, partial [Rotaria sp. Silwood1]